MTIIRIDDVTAIPRASEIVSGGGLIAFPTDTVYGVGCDPFNQSAVRRIERVKNRSKGRLPVLVDLIENAKKLGLFNAASTSLAEAFWPGPLTLVMTALVDFPTEISGEGTVGLRIPDRSDTCRLINACGGRLVGTSANLSGMPSARTAVEVERAIGSMIDLVVDGGPCTSNRESTVLDVSKIDEVRLLREGAVSEELIRKVVSPIKWSPER